MATIVLLKMAALTRRYMVALDPGHVILGITILRLVATTQKEEVIPLTQI
jgi:hypothetical protein